MLKLIILNNLNNLLYKNFAEIKNNNLILFNKSYFKFHIIINIIINYSKKKILELVEFKKLNNR